MKTLDTYHVKVNLLGFLNLSSNYSNVPHNTIVIEGNIKEYQLCFVVRYKMKENTNISF